MSVPRILIAGLRGGSGKTLVTLGVLAAWRQAGRRVAPFKKGPDFIDASWLTEAAAQPCRNLDAFLMSNESIIESLIVSSRGSDAAIIEGNRGLFDGVDVGGTYSTAELAKMLRAPVVLIVDCSKSTRTIAALVLGCQALDPDVPLRGVILNQIAGSRHESIVRASIDEACNGLTVLGAIPRLPQFPLPERHLGLVPPREHESRAGAIDRAAEIVSKHVDLDALWNCAQTAPSLNFDAVNRRPEPASPSNRVRIGVFKDAAFEFYYPENLEAITQCSGELVTISPTRDRELPQLDAIYIGGGFPETLAPSLAENVSFRKSLRIQIEHGLPVYAECGGAVFLGKDLEYEGQHYPMVGVLPASFEFQSKPQGHGYVELDTVNKNPFFQIGDCLRGHEFHYTRIRQPVECGLTFAFHVKRGIGFDGEHDGLCHRNVLACYTHIHALGVPQWAPALIRSAARYQMTR